MLETTSTLNSTKEYLAQGGKIYKAKAYAAGSADSDLAPASIQRRTPRPQDVQIEVLYCGVCHSDLHQVRDEWHEAMPTVYPCVPGHEIVGRVTRVGSTVQKFKEGDLAAVGCMVGSCGICESCREGLEQYCEKIPVLTYNSEDKVLGGVTYGGYSDSIVAGSGVGGIRETQEMLDFCADHGITADIELISIQQINQAYQRLLKSDVKYRFVIDMASLK